jgi:L-alanine-DL-glutamate epimerase-like enolase superfamily enzyme
MPDSAVIHPAPTSFNTPAIDKVEVSAFIVPTDFPESDGTLTWQSTTLVLVEIGAEASTGVGYTYSDRSAATFISSVLEKEIVGSSALAPVALSNHLLQRSRNLGHTSIAAMAISAIDCAAWDLKAKLLNVPLATLLGAVRDSVPIYGSGGFTSYSIEQLQRQLGGWVEEGIPRVKMKVGRDASADPSRVCAVRESIGDAPELFVDANGAYGRKQALSLAQQFADEGVSWFEEPVIAEDLPGLHLVRDRAPAVLEIAAGEYGFDLEYFWRMIDAGAVDVLQADVTRCLGITGFLQAATLCQAFHIPLSAHCAPALHIHVGCAAVPLRHIEYFHDHVRIERMFFEGVPEPQHGELRPDWSRPGCGLEFKHGDAERFQV